MKKLGLLLLAAVLLVGLSPKAAFAAVKTDFEQDLSNYLTQVSAERGFEVGAEDIEESLAVYGLSVEDFSTVEELKSFLGDAIQTDLSNLDSIYESYGLDQTSLIQRLGEYGEELKDYIYLNDLDTALSVYTSTSGSASGIDKAMILEILKQFDLSDSEVQKLKDYLVSNQEYLNSESVEKQLKELETRMTAFGEALLEKENVDASYKPSDKEISEITSMYDELFSILKMKAEFYLTGDGSDTPITMAELLKLDGIDTEDVKIMLYGPDSQLLADIIVPNEMLSSKLEEVIKEVADSSDRTVHTEKGGKLPKTASDYLENTLLGLMLAAAGMLTWRKVRKGNVEAFRKQA